MRNAWLIWYEWKCFTDNLPYLLFPFPCHLQLSVPLVFMVMKISILTWLNLCVCNWSDLMIQKKLQPGQNRKECVAKQVFRHQCVFHLNSQCLTDRPIFFPTSWVEAMLDIPSPGIFTLIGACFTGHRLWRSPMFRWIKHRQLRVVTHEPFQSNTCEHSYHFQRTLVNGQPLKINEVRKNYVALLTRRSFRWCLERIVLELCANRLEYTKKFEIRLSILDFSRDPFSSIICFQNCRGSLRVMCWGIVLSWFHSAIK